MMLDHQGRDEVYAFLQAGGYAGTQDQWLERMRRSSYDSELRLFSTIWLGPTTPLLDGFPAAKAFLRRALQTAQPHFCAVSANHNFPEASIGLYGGHPHTPGEPAVRLSCLGLEISVQDERVTVRCSFSVAGEIRRWRTHSFPRVTTQNNDKP